MQMHTTIEQPLTRSSTGRIKCRVMGVEPVDFTWYGPDGHNVHTESYGEEATGVIPGTYRVVATDAQGQRADVTLDVEEMFANAVVVTGYIVHNATTATSRDGSVEVVGQGLEHVRRFLWTHGHETETPVLCDVPCGLYSVVPLGRDGETLTFIQRCGPARILTSSATSRDK